MLQIIAPGSLVTIGKGERERFEAEVLAVCIHPGERVTYQVVWWSGRERKTDWVERWELVCVHTTAVKSIGFS